LRKKIATVVAYHFPSAVQKGITLVIFFSPETPNYFQGNASCFLVMLSQLLKHVIESLKQGDLSIRIYHDSLHRIIELCRYVDGNFLLQKISGPMTQYLVACVLQRTHPA
jgi:hypothetical protein